MKSENLVTTAKKVEIDWTHISEYSRLIEEEIEEYSNIEVTENLREGGIHAQKAWGFWFHYLSEQVWKTSLHAEIIQFCNGIGDLRILSLGCGYGGVELEIAQSLKSAYQMTAVDLNPGILAKARAEAQAKNLNIQFLPLDLNFVQIKDKTFDLIIAHASLHHLLNLKHVFSQIYRGLKDQGRLIVQDIIGKTQVLFWKPNVDFAIDLMRKMPPKFGAGIDLPPYSEPSIQIGMEGVRQEEIEPLLSDYFTPIKMFKFGSFMRMICTHPILGKRFDPDIEEDRQYLQRLFDLDVRQVEEGRLRPTEMLAVYEKRDSINIDAINAEARDRIDAFLASGKTGTSLQHAPNGGIMRRMVMDEYAAWEPTERTHSASAFITSTLRAIEEILPEHVENSAETGCGKSTILFSNIAEREGQINNLNQAVADRDGQIGIIKLTLAESDLDFASPKFSLRRFQTPLQIGKRFVKTILHPLKAYELVRDIHIIRISNLFDNGYYLTKYRDVRIGICDPIRHYCEFGWKERRNPSPLFDTNLYLLSNTDVENLGMNPFVHYIMHGQHEGRNENSG